MTAVKARGETAFDEAGDGCILCFTNRNLKELQAKLRAKYNMLDKNAVDVPHEVVKG